jgi:EAL domain-containing protein (putative c-di-GMP-specific phosphodiesterase class I)
VFQPIVELESADIVGYEALSRGPRGTEYENPYFLFDTAKDVGLIFELDRICRRKALIASAQLEPDARIFINVLPSTIQDPEFKGIYLQELLADVQRQPQKIVIEVSEREAIDDYPAFRTALKHYSDLGFSIAVDDTGAGYSSLEAIVELQPHYMKLDISMVRNIHEHPLKQELIRAITAFSTKIDATIIAEGVETQEERETLVGLGVPLGQGYFFGRPREYGKQLMEQDQSAPAGSADPVH